MRFFERIPIYLTGPREVAELHLSTESIGHIVSSNGGEVLRQSSATDIMSANTSRPPRRRQPDGQDHFHAGTREGRPVANPRTSYERYISLARESVAVGDTVQTENWLQHADHYFRMMRDPAS